MMIFLASTLTPAFAEVTSFQLDKMFYTKGDKILFSGTVDEESKGLVTIVVRDSNNEFVLLTQAFIQPDDTFERDLVTNERFEDHGIHNATAFVIDLAKGKTVSFDFSQDGTLPVPSITPKQVKTTTEKEPVVVEGNSITQTNSEPSVNEKPEIADFVDPTKDPQHYLDRYYNEPSYKKWFDRNYPELTIEEAVGLAKLDSDITQTIEKNLENTISKDVIQEAEAVQHIDSSLNDIDSENNEFASLGLTLGGMAVLFGAIYGIKRKVDTNSKNITQNRESIRKKVFGAILNNNPEDVIKNRLAQGEITVSEYNNLKKALRRK